MKKAVFIIIAISISLSALGQTKKVKWYTIDEAQALAKKNPRPLFVDTYTDWCGWCKKLDQETFSNDIIAEMLNTKFYPVKFDAEGKTPVNFQGQTFVNDGKSGASHQFAIALLKGQMSYPNLVFFNEKMQLLTNIPGYETAKQLELLLSFISEKAYEKQNIQDYEKNFKSSMK